MKVTKSLIGNYIIKLDRYEAGWLEVTLTRYANNMPPITKDSCQWHLDFAKSIVNAKTVKKIKREIIHKDNQWFIVTKNLENPDDVIIHLPVYKNRELARKAKRYLDNEKY